MAAIGAARLNSVLWLSHAPSATRRCRSHHRCRSVDAAFRLVVHGAEQTAAELAPALQRKYDGIKDFSADFAHTYEGGVLKKQITERGRLLVKKPGKMRWDYTAPEQKQFVSDGVKMYSYIPQDKQVIVTPVPPDDEADDADAVPGRQGQPDARFHRLARRRCPPACRPAAGR